MSARHPLILLTVVATSLGLAGCSSSFSSAATADTLSLSLTSPFVTVTPGAAPMYVVASSLRSAGSTGAITVSISDVPAGVSVTITQPGSGAFGTVAFTGAVTAIPGVYPVTISSTDGTATATAALTLTVNPVDAISVSATTPNAIVRQDAAPATIPVTITRSIGNSNSVTLAASGYPTGMTPSYTQPGAGSTGAVTFTTSTAPALAGTYTVTLTATDTAATPANSKISLTLVVAPVLTVTNATDTTVGVAGHLQQFMSTGFQPSTYNNGFFTSNPGTADLAALKSLHLRLQPVFGALPWLANSSPAAATDWNFTGLDATVQPVLIVGDKSPVFQIAKAPQFLDDTNGHFVYNSANLALLTSYAQNLVRYYNTGGFDVGGKHFQSASSTPIKWWAIFNEPNLNNITPAQYVSIYNTLVPAMLSVDPTLKFVALELSDFTGEPQKILPTVVAPITNGGINPAPSAFATHFYGTCMQSATDAKLFSDVSQFVADIGYLHSELSARSDLAAVPVWVTENNVNSDFPLTTGFSSCTPTIQYILDPRGTSAFFTAYRPLVFSQLGKAGNESLYHFLYEGSAAYGEVNSGSAAKTLAYWTDYWLQRTFPWDGVSTGSSLYKTTNSEASPDVDTLAALNADGSVSLMVTNYATASTTDDNGAGAPRTVVVNLAALRTFTSGTEVDFSSVTSPLTGPVSAAITPGATLTLTFSGYGSSMFVLKP